MKTARMDTENLLSADTLKSGVRGKIREKLKINNKLFLFFILIAMIFRAMSGNVSNATADDDNSEPFCV